MVDERKRERGPGPPHALSEMLIEHWSHNVLIRTVNRINILAADTES